MVRRYGDQLRLLWQRLPLMDRWLISELTGPLLFGIAAFTAVSLSVGVVFELVRKVAEAGLPPLVAMQVLSLRLPGFLVLSFPMATLMATLLGYSRLSGSSELTALRSIGVSTRRMVMPALTVAAVMTGLTFVFNDLIVPSANLAAADTLDAALGRAIASERGSNVVYPRFGPVMIKEGNTLRSEEGLAQLFYARESTGGGMSDVTLLDFSRAGNHQMLIAKTAVWNDARSMWEFRDGRIVNISSTGASTTSAVFDRYFYPFTSAPLDVARLPSSAEQMTVRQASQAQRLLASAGDYKEARRLSVRIQENSPFQPSVLSSV